MNTAATSLREHGIIAMLRAGLDTAEERRESVPAALLLLLAWLGFLAWLGPFVRSPVASAVLAVVPRVWLLWGVPAVLLGVAVTARAAHRRGLATLAVMLIAYHAGTGLMGMAYGWASPWTTELRETWWLSFSIRRVLYGVATCLPMALVAMLLLRGDLRPRFGPGDWSVTTRLSAKEPPAAWARVLLGVSLVAALPLLLLMQFAVGFEPITSGRIVTLLLPILVVALVNASAEEAIFRGFMLPTVIGAVGAPRGLWLVGIWFGLHHWGLSVQLLTSLPGALFLGIGSVYFGKSVLETRGLGWAVAMHAVFDIAIFSAFYGRI